MTLKLFRLSWISALSPPVRFKLVAFFFFTHCEVNLVKMKISIPGTNVTIPSRKLIVSKKIPAPVIVAKVPINYMSDWEKNVFILSVSLFIREIRSPALFWLKNASGNSWSLLKTVLRSLNSIR